ncbi:MAG TPA: hypothetical protein VES73_09480, partial [Lamprocystis sp. (in: g-proteobacteria)]|nr:hypothetical protein [Lamprocystis sp. (in: g-proteobacteria)]
MPLSIDRRIAYLPRWRRRFVGALPGLLIALLTLGALALAGDPGKAMLGTLGEGPAALLLLPILSAISGILVNVASERLLDWERQALAARDFFRNHDLAQLVGRSIGMVLRAVAPELGSQDAALVRRLADRAELHWTDIAFTDSARKWLGSIGERRLVEFVARPERPALTPAQTVALLACLNPERPGTSPDFEEATAESRVRLALATRFSESVHQALKQDAALDGRAAYAMHLDIANRVLTVAAANLERNAENAAALAAVRDTLDELLPRLEAQGIEIGAGIADLARRLAGIEQTVRVEGELTREVVRETAESTQLRLAAIEAQLREVLTPKQAGEDPTQRQLPPELIAKAQDLAERGNKEQQAVAAIALRQHAAADRLIQDLKREPLAEAFRLLTLEGDNWDNAGAFDRAIGPYEQALALRPEDPRAMTSAAIAHAQARLGDIAAHQRKAIALLTQAQGTWTREAHPVDWAMTQNSVGIAWRNMPTGDPAENLGKAIAAYALALEVLTREAHPADWATTQNNLGNAWAQMPTGDPAENLGKAIAAYGLALEVRTREAHPADWAMTQNNLGVAWAQMPTGERAENLGKALAAYGLALEVYSREARPAEWAMTQNNIGNAWLFMLTGDRVENLGKAIVAYRLALEVYTRAAHPAGWATTHNNLGNAWAQMPSGDPAENLSRAIAAYGLALEVYTREAHPADWAKIQNNLGNAWSDMLS